jgi:hypothetical protein
MLLLRTNLLAFAVYVAIPIGAASALPCTGAPPFTDVAAGASYCTDAEWLKNRSITLGCTSQLFCPNDVVTRGAMALFIQRLGTALSPQVLTIEVTSGAFDLDSGMNVIVCQTADFAVTGYPRKALLQSTFAGDAAGALEFQHDIFYSTDGGQTWEANNLTSNYAGTAAAHWVNSSFSYSQDLEVGTTYRWGTRLSRWGSTANDFTFSKCFMNVIILNRTGTTSPF